MTRLMMIWHYKAEARIFACLITLSLFIQLCVSCSLQQPAAITAHEAQSNETTTQINDTVSGSHKLPGIDLERLTQNDINNVINTSAQDFAFYDGYMFYVYESRTIRKLDLQSGYESSACVDPGCTHSDSSCPLYALFITRIDYIKDDKIYFYGNSRGSATLYVYDMKNGNLEELMVINTAGGGCPRHFEYGEQYIFQISDLKEGGNPNNEEDYVAKVISVDKKTGEKATLFEVEQGSYLTFILNGRFYFKYLLYSFYSTNDSGDDRIDLGDCRPI